MWVKKVGWVALGGELVFETLENTNHLNLMAVLLCICIWFSATFDERPFSTFDHAQTGVFMLADETDTFNNA